MLKVGIAGFGFMGRMHRACWQRTVDAQVVAVCDSNPYLLQEVFTLCETTGRTE